MYYLVLKYIHKLNKSVDALGTFLEPKVEETLENLIKLGAEGARRKSRISQAKG